MSIGVLGCYFDTRYKNESSIAICCDKFIDGNTYALLQNLKSPPDSCGEAGWHPTDPKAMIYVSNKRLDPLS